MATLTLRPNANGGYQEWSTFGGTSHYGNTSDQSTTTGVEVSNTTSLETEALQGVSGYSGIINSVTAYMQARAYNGSGDERAAILWLVNKSLYESGAFALTSSWQNFFDQRTTNPNTSAAWLWEEIEELQVGSRATVVSSSEFVQVAEFWVEVDYTPVVLYQESDSGTGTDSVEALHAASDSGELALEKARVYKTTAPEPESNEETLGAATRMVELIRVGNINLKSDYPGKQIVRLRDMSAFYEGKPVTNLAELYEYVRGKRLSAVNIDIWDQISGAYLGAYNTDKNGTLVLPTDRKFVEVLQWKIAGGGYSDCFNGERAAGMPGLFFYFPCNEAKGQTISSFPGVSGQQVTLPEGWDWYESGFFNRPSLKVGTDQLSLFTNWPKGINSFQFLWYCKDPSKDYELFNYSEGTFKVSVKDGKLEGKIPLVSAIAGMTELDEETWYLIQIGCEMGRGAFASTAYSKVSMKVFIGGEEELEVEGMIEVSNTSELPLSMFIGEEDDGFDEIRHMNRELYPSEIMGYANFLKQGRVFGKSRGTLGSTGW